MQVGFITIGRDGDVGAFALIPGFSYAVTDASGRGRVLPSPSLRS